MFRLQRLQLLLRCSNTIQHKNYYYNCNSIEVSQDDFTSRGEPALEIVQHAAADLWFRKVDRLLLAVINSNRIISWELLQTPK